MGESKYNQGAGDKERKMGMAGGGPACQGRATDGPQRPSQGGRGAKGSQHRPRSRAAEETGPDREKLGKEGGVAGEDSRQVAGRAQTDAAAASAQCPWFWSWKTREL